MIFLYPRPASPRMSFSEVSISGTPSSMPGMRCECISAASALKSLMGLLFFFRNREIMNRLVRSGYIYQSFVGAASLQRIFLVFFIDPANALFKADPGFPAHCMQLGDIHQFPRRAIGLAKIICQLTGIADYIFNQQGKLPDLQVLSGPDIDESGFIIMLH